MFYQTCIATGDFINVFVHFEIVFLVLRLRLHIIEAFRVKINQFLLLVIISFVIKLNFTSLFALKIYIVMVIVNISGPKVKYL